MFTLAWVLCECAAGNAQSSFQRIVYSDNHEVGRIIAPDHNGYILGGVATHPDAHTGGYLLKTNTSGEMIWNKGILWGHYSEITALLPTPGGYFAAGRYRYYSGGGLDSTFIVKIDPAGEVTWSRKFFFGIDNNQPRCMIRTSDGGILIAGSYQSASFQIEGFVLKLDDEGNLLWARNYQLVTASPGPGPIPPGYNSLNIGDVVQDNQGDFYFFGQIPDSTEGSWLMKTDAQGNVLSARLFKTNKLTAAGNAFRPLKIEQMADETFYLLYATEQVEPDEAFLLLHTHSDGSLLEAERYRIGGKAGHFLNARRNAANELLVAGNVWNNDNFSQNDPAVVKIQPSTGDVQWAYGYEPEAGHYLYDAAHSDDGGCIYTGEAYLSHFSRGASPGDLNMVKTAPGGSGPCESYPLELTRHAVAVNDQAYSITSTDISSAAWFGPIVPRTFAFYTDTLFCLSTGIHAPAPAQLSIVPNPSGGLFTIELEAAKQASVSIRLYSLTGRLISNKYLPVVGGKNVIRFDETGLAPGMYFVNVNNGGMNTVEKLLIR